LLIGKAPLRISFSGGGTDLASYYRKFEGRVVSATINRFVHVQLNCRGDGRVNMKSDDYRTTLAFNSGELPPPQRPFEIALSAMRSFNPTTGGLDMSINSDVPPGSGLGSSGAMAVAMVDILSSNAGKHLTKYEVAEKAYEIGHDTLGLPIGKQDEYASAFGGMNEFIFTEDKVQVRPLIRDPESLNELERNLMLFYLCETREASEILRVQDERTLRGDPAIMEALHRSREFAVECRKAIESGDVEDLGRLLDCSWQQKKKYTEKVTNARVDLAYQTAIRAGAYGGKLTGAGGAGHLLLCCAPENQRKVEESMSALGVKRVNFMLESNGVNIEDGESIAGC
jgi:D-glycero-alpha-D-manno-heptose-7-phosphate kinase